MVSERYMPFIRGLSVEVVKKQPMFFGAQWHGALSPTEKNAFISISNRMALSL